MPRYSRARALDSVLDSACLLRLAQNFSLISIFCVLNGYDGKGEGRICYGLGRRDGGAFKTSTERGINFIKCVSIEVPKLIMLDVGIQLFVMFNRVVSLMCVKSVKKLSQGPLR